MNNTHPIFQDIFKQHGMIPESKVTIKKAIRIDDRLPLNVSIEVEYEKQYNVIIVSSWSEDSSPYDNPTDVWIETMKEVIVDYFYEQDRNLEVVFK